jgi:protoporphyrinogen/coproporphyrinogen III oxidase
MLAAYPGLKTLPTAIAAKVEDKVRCNWRLVALKKASDGLYELQYDTNDGERTVRAKSVGLTVPSYVISDLLKSVVPDAASALANVDYPPVCAVTLAYPEDAIKVCMPSHAP